MRVMSQQARANFRSSRSSALPDDALRHISQRTTFGRTNLTNGVGYTLDDTGERRLLRIKGFLASLQVLRKLITYPCVL
jgi:hypothetical protein